MTSPNPGEKRPTKGGRISLSWYRCCTDTNWAKIESLAQRKVLLMHIEELRIALRKFNILSWLYIVPPLALLIFVTPENAPKFFSWLVSTGLGESQVRLGVIIFAVPLSVIAIFLPRKPHLPRCPACNATIDSKQADIVIATKNCTNCGENIISSSSISL